VRNAAIEAGLITEAEIEEVMLLLSDPKFTAHLHDVFGHGPQAGNGENPFEVIRKHRHLCIGAQGALCAH
jgi:hypothetical protein